MPPKRSISFCAQAWKGSRLAWKSSGSEALSPTSSATRTATSFRSSAHGLRGLDGLAVLDHERVDPLGRAQVLELVLAEVAQLELAGEQVAGRLREKHLTALGGPHDARGAVDVEAGKELAVSRGLARMQADPDAERLTRPGMRGVCALGGGGRVDRLARAGEGEVEAVALHLDLGPVVGDAGLPQEPPVRVERFDVALAAQRLE